MNDSSLPGHLAKRLEELIARESSYLEDELYSIDAITNLDYREALERQLNLDPLGPLPPRQPNISL